MTRPLASIIVTSYNYGRYLNDAIDSALAQTYPDTEVVVVDDGSTDHSPAVIASYADRIVAVLKKNGGQASSLNAGFGASRGDVVLFLDSDDMLHPTAVEHAVGLFRDATVAKVHWPLVAVDARGQQTGRMIPGSLLPDGDLREEVIRDGPYAYTWPDTSGNAWARRFLEQVLPMPEAEYVTCPDLYLSAFAPLYGSIGRISEPQASYRDHGGNSSSRNPFVERVDEGRAREQHCVAALAALCRSRGISVDADRWKANSWWHQIERASREITRLVPPGASFILVDDDHWGLGADLAGRRRLWFSERDGEYLGEPADDATAIDELERLRRGGAGFIAFVWPYLWWLDHYADLNRHLRVTSSCLIENDCVTIFDLRLGADAARENAGGAP